MIVVCFYLPRNESSGIKAPSCPDFHRLDFVTRVKISFLNFSSLSNYVLKKAIVYSDRAWNSLSVCIFTYFLAFKDWKKIWIQWTHSEWTSTKNLHFSALRSFLFELIIPMGSFFFEKAVIDSDRAWNCLSSGVFVNYLASIYWRIM